MATDFFHDDLDNLAQAFENEGEIDISQMIDEANFLLHGETFDFSPFKELITQNYYREKKDYLKSSSKDRLSLESTYKMQSDNYLNSILFLLKSRLKRDDPDSLIRDNAKLYILYKLIKDIF